MSLIQNAVELSQTPLRVAALSIAEAGLLAIKTDQVIRDHVSLLGDILTIAGKTYDLKTYDRLIVAGVGKCSLDAARELEKILGEHISAGFVLDVRCDPSLTHIKSCAGTHPFPSEDNITHTAALLTLLESATEKDLVLFIVSGGGSTLLCSPLNGVCDDEKNLLQKLFAAGATIEDINMVRKHLSKARGGYIAQAVYPAELVALVFSDVPGDDITTIASGPTVRDTTTKEDVLERLNIFCSEGIDTSLLLETPKEEKYFAKTRTVLALTNKTALYAMKEKAEALGFHASIKDSALTGDAQEVAGRISDALKEIAPKSVLLYGGETTVADASGLLGKGGRNQELALAALIGIGEDELVLTLASDGRDNSDHAGALADTLVQETAAQAGEDIETRLLAHESYDFFEKTGAAILTGYTGSNVSDLIVAIKG